MITIYLNGGLGNQMFQYAMGRALSIKNNTDLILDTSWYNNTGKNTRRFFDLEKFNIRAKILPPTKIPIYKKIKHKFRFLNRNYKKEKKIFDFDDKLITSNEGYFEGYWQNINYFRNINSEILLDFTLKNTPPKEVLTYKERIDTFESVSIHIRRGDYITNTEANGFHGVCQLEYYRKAISFIKEKISDPYFFIFSDDILWIEKNLIIDAKFELVGYNKFNDVEEFFLMSNCKHNIIANSTFSWWAAYLNNNKEKIVVAPKKWINTKEIKTDGLFPNEWITI